jgi:hypothetical protein
MARLASLGRDAAEKQSASDRAIRVAQPIRCPDVGHSIIKVVIAANWNEFVCLDIAHFFSIARIRIAACSESLLGEKSLRN